MDRWSLDGEFSLFYDVNKVLNRYARGVDRKDWDLMLSAFHDDAVDDHGSSSGSPRDFAAAFSAAQEFVEQCQHVNGNVALLEIDRENHEVLVETYCIGTQRLVPDAPSSGPLFIAPHIDASLPTGRLLSVGNRYLDLMTERDGELRIARRLVIYEWLHVEPSDDQAVLPGRTLARRDQQDPSYTTIAEFRL